jgi:ferrochelatase
MRRQKRLAVVLFNLGGPDGPDAVEPFLFNLFNDPAIIGLPGIVRKPLAKLVSSRRAPAARANYDLMGGSSPLLPETEKQARALETALTKAQPAVLTRCFVAMRYWKPFTEDAAGEVEAFAPDQIVLLPLYPQFSTTTTGSSLKAWQAAYRGPGQTHTVCCYPDASGLVEAWASKIAELFERGGRPADLRLLFSAHGLPEKVVKAGDPYQVQVEATAAAIAARLPQLPDWQVCYQSRVGPMKWIGPSTEQAIGQAKADGKGVLIAPIAFVSEHVETLVELDHEYAALAARIGLSPYLRAPAVGNAGGLRERPCRHYPAGHGTNGRLARARGAFRLSRPGEMPVGGRSARGWEGGMTMNWYDLIRGLHILAVIAWMAGLLYLPRLFVYHTRVAPGSEMDANLQEMEAKLHRIIMVPAMIVAWLLGIALLGFRTGFFQDWSVLAQPWLILKLAGVLFLTWWQQYLGAARKRFAAGQNTRSEKFWRMTNELPFLAAIVMVLAVTTEFSFG